MSHTPGPWHVRGGVSGVYSADIVGPNQEDIGYANPSDGADDAHVYPVEANARLMAAAPELLEAALYAYQSLRAYQEHLDAGQYNTVEEKDTIDLLRDAIKKAGATV